MVERFLNHPVEMCPLDDKVDTNAAAKTCRAPFEVSGLMYSKLVNGMATAACWFIFPRRAPGAPMASSQICPGSQEACGFSRAQEKEVEAREAAEGIHFCSQRFRCNG